MDIMSRLLNPPRKKHRAGWLPANWEQTLHQCNFFMARRGIALFFDSGHHQAEIDRHRSPLPKDLEYEWGRFSANPNYDSAVRFLEVAPNMFPYFEESFQKLLFPAISTASSFSLEQFRLQDELSGLRELRELSREEYVMFPRQFRDEAIYSVKPVHFMGRRWKFIVSSVHGTVFRWEAILELGRDEAPALIGSEVIRHCIHSLGATTEEISGYLFWDTPDGSVTLQFMDMDDFIRISIVALSCKTSNFTRL